MGSLLLRTLAILAPCLVVAPLIGVDAEPVELGIMALWSSLSLDIASTLTPIAAAKLRRTLGKK